MTRLTKKQAQEIIGYLQTGLEVPEDYKHLLFPPERKEYELVYAEKEREEDIIANTWGVPLQAVKTFNLSKNAPRPEWTNRLIFGDNLQVMKRLLDDPQVKGKVKLVYIDPPFATKQDFRGSQDQKAYQDKIAGAQFIEFIRKRLVIIKDLLSSDGSICASGL
jgi:site-specific DNA-methyltransferase (adenine-specific)/adenine-specific DNA-methyltransferase